MLFQFGVLSLSLSLSLTLTFYLPSHAQVANSISILGWSRLARPRAHARAPALNNTFFHSSFVQFSLFAWFLLLLFVCLLVYSNHTNELEELNNLVVSYDFVVQFNKNSTDAITCTYFIVNRKLIGLSDLVIGHHNNLVTPNSYLKIFFFVTSWDNTCFGCHRFLVACTFLLPAGLHFSVATATLF